MNITRSLLFAAILAGALPAPAFPQMAGTSSASQNPATGTTAYLGVQYGLPAIGFNQGSGCVDGYAACFAIPSGRQLREGRGSLTIKQPNIEVLVIIVCGVVGETVMAMEALYPGTYTWSTPVISQADPWMTGPANGCAVSWQADNNTGGPIAPGAAFEVQGVFSTW